VDRIKDMLAEGYSLTETATKLGHSTKTVAKYGVDTEPPQVQRESRKMDLSLSDGDIKLLYNLQGILEVSSVSDAIERAFQDELAAMNYKRLIWDKEINRYRTEGKQLTVRALIKLLTDSIDSLKDELKMFRDGYHEDQKIIEKLEKAAKEKVYIIP